MRETLYRYEEDEGEEEGGQPCLLKEEGWCA